jgi:hypothetical protein
LYRGSWLPSHDQLIAADTSNVRNTLRLLAAGYWYVLVRGREVETDRAAQCNDHFQRGHARQGLIPQSLESRIARHWKKHDQPDVAFNSFHRALARTTIQLSKGQVALSLRCIFASHFLQSGRYFFTLQRVLGYSR